MYFLKSLIITIATLIAFSSFAQAPRLTVVGEIFRPFSYEEKEVKKGMVTEIVQEILNESKMTPSKWIISPWKYVYKYAKDHKNTLLYTVVKNPEREKLPLKTGFLKFAYKNNIDIIISITFNKNKVFSEKKMLFNKNIELFNIQSNIINPKYYDNENLFIEEINKIWYKIYFQNE